MSEERTAGELMFETYLAEHGYAEPEHHPNLGVKKRPDYLVRRGTGECICEVKEFDRDQPSLPWIGGGGGSTSMKVVLQPIRAKIRSAARQLKPLTEGGRALVVVIANPDGAHVALGEREVVWAMYGDPVYSFEVDPETGAQVGEGQLGAGRHGKLRNDHPYISAVAVVSERQRAVDFYDDLAEGNKDLSRAELLDAIFAARDSGKVPQGSYNRVDVFRSLSQEAVALPDTFFGGPNDRLFEFDPQTAAYRQIRGRTLA